MIAAAKVQKVLAGMRTIVITTFAMAMAVPGLSAVAATPQSPALRVVGDSTSYSTLRLTEPTEWPLSTAVQTKGSYAGLLVQRVHERAISELFLYARAANFGDRPQMFPVVYHRHLPAGRYRFTLLTDGSTRIAFETRGVTGRTIHPVTHAHAELISVDARVGGEVPVAHAVMPIPVHPHQVTVVMGAEETAASQASFIQLCVTSDAGCPPRATYPFVTPGCAVGCETGIEQQLVYLPGQLARGQQAILTAGAVGVERFASLVLLRIHSRR